MCKQPYVDYIEEDQMIYGESQTSQWNLDRIDQRFLPLNRKYSPRNNGAGVDIFVLDTGKLMAVLNQHLSTFIDKH